MPSTCCVPRCNGNYNRDNKVSIFRFPQDEELKLKWIAAIYREEFHPSKGSRVCARHFEPGQITREASGYDPKTNRTITAPLSFPRLKEGAIPTIFAPDCPSVPKSKLARKKNRPKRAPKEETQTTVPKLLEVCEQHFKESDYITTASGIHDKTGELIVVQLKNKRLRPDAIPSIFPCYTEFAKKSSRSKKASIEDNSTSQNAGHKDDNAGLGTESPDATEQCMIKQEQIESTDELPYVAIDNIFTVEELPPSYNSSSVFEGLSLSSSLSPSNSLPSSSGLPSSSNSSIFTCSSIPAKKVGKPLTNIPGGKRKINIAKSDDSGYLPSDIQSKVPRVAQRSRSPKQRSEADSSSKSKKPVLPTKDTLNATTQIFQTLLSGSENRQVPRSRTREAPGDLFDVLAGFIADKLRQMNWENCAFALRAILDIVFKAGQAQQSSEEEDSDVEVD